MASDVCKARSLIVALAVFASLAVLMIWAGLFIAWGALVPLLYALVALFIIALTPAQPEPASTAPPHAPTAALANDEPSYSFSPLFVATLCIAALLLFSSMLYRAERDYRERMFAAPTSIPFSNFTVQVSYPVKLWRDSPDKRGLPLVVSLVSPATPTPVPPTATPNPTATATSVPTDTPVAVSPVSSATPLRAPLALVQPTQATYILLVSAPAAVLLTDAEAEIVAPRLELSESQPAAMLFLRLDPSSDISAPVQLTLREFSAESGVATNAQSFDIQIEWQQEAMGRMLSGQLLGDASLLLTIAVAFVGWMLEANRRRNEERQQERERLKADNQREVARLQQERKELAEAIGELVMANPVAGIAKFTQRPQDSLNPELEHSIKEQAKALWSNEQTRLSLLHLAGEHVNTKSLQAFRDTTSALSLIFDDSFGDDIAMLADVLLSSQTTTVDINKTAQAVHRISSQHHSAWDICVPVLVRLLEIVEKSSKGDREALFNQLIEPFYYAPKQFKPGRSVLLDDKVIIGLRQLNTTRSGDVVKALLEVEHNWRNINISIPETALFPPMSEAAQAWWESKKSRPWLATKSLLGSATLTLKIYQEGVDFNRNMYIQCKHNLDTIIALETIHHGVSVPAAQRTIMPVDLVLPSPTKLTVEHSEALALHFARAVAERWIALLHFKPENFLTLRAPDQYGVLRLVAWFLGSHAACETIITDDLHPPVGLPLQMDRPELEQARVVAERKIILYRLKQSLERDGIPQPTLAEALAWLRLRPRPLASTLFVLQCRDDTALEQTLELLGSFLPRLALVKCHVALLGSLSAVEASTYASLPVDPSSMREALDSVLGQAAYGDGGKSFEDLCAKASQPACEAALVRLMQRANGSLATLLRDISAVVEYHVKRFEGKAQTPTNRSYRFLSVEDFEAVLSAAE